MKAHVLVAFSRAVVAAGDGSFVLLSPLGGDAASGHRRQAARTSPVRTRARTRRGARRVRVGAIPARRNEPHPAIAMSALPVSRPGSRQERPTVPIGRIEIRFPRICRRRAVERGFPLQSRPGFAATVPAR